jgi:hypothetical protein
MDNLSGLSVMAMKMVTGSKPMKSVGDWGVAMDNLGNLVMKLSTDLKCLFVMIGHLEREHDEVTGSIKLMASTLGKKLAPTIPRTFSDVIETVREGNSFFWRTDSTQTMTKTRNLPIIGKIDPDFMRIVNSWKSRGGKISS